MSIIGYVAGSRSSGPRALTTLAIFGPGRVNRVGNHWSGHHHIHLTRFRNQAFTASENERIYGEAFGNIIARAIFDRPEAARNVLPKSLRLFDDLGAYVALNGTLWVQSRTSIAIGEEYADSNHGHLVYEHQVKAEILDYVYALHRRIAEASTGPTSSLDDIFSAQRDLADFELDIHDVSHFGEIRELLEEGLKAYGVQTFRNRMADAIQVRQAIASQTQTRIAERVATVLALIAGGLAIPSLATSVISPLWLWQGWPGPTRTEPMQLIQVGVATGVAVCLLGLGIYWARRLSPISKKR